MNIRPGVVWCLNNLRLSKHVLRKAGRKTARADGSQKIDNKPERQARAGGSEPGPSSEDIAAAQQMSPQQRMAMINQMVEGLAGRLKTEGKDLKGWLRLVRAYTVLGDKAAAKQALADARGNFSDDNDALAQLGQLEKTLGLGS